MLIFFGRIFGAHSAAVGLALCAHSVR